MNKKTLLLGTLLIVSVLTVGCNKNPDSGKSSDPVSTAESTVPESINIEDTEPATEYVDATASVYENEAIVSTGVLKNEPEDSDDYGNQRACFTKAGGSEFIAIISETTEVPEQLVPGVSYDVYHSELELRSFPGQFPEVYKIIKSE
jgi:hypothetical protein